MIEEQALRASSRDYGETRFRVNDRGNDSWILNRRRSPVGERELMKGEEGMCMLGRDIPVSREVCNEIFNEEKDGSKKITETVVRGHADVLAPGSSCFCNTRL